MPPDRGTKTILFAAFVLIIAGIPIDSGGAFIFLQIGLLIALLITTISDIRNQDGPPKTILEKVERIARVFGAIVCVVALAVVGLVIAALAVCFGHLVYH